MVLMALQKRIIPDAHHEELKKKKPGDKGLFRTKAEAEAAAGPKSWIAVKGDANGKAIDKNGVLIDAVRPDGYSAEDWVKAPRLEKIYGLVAQAVLPEFPTE